MVKIIICLANSTGRNIAFITDDLVLRDLEEAIVLVKSKMIDGVHVVSGKDGPYIRADRNDIETDNLDFLAISLAEFFCELKNEAISRATKLYQDLLEKKLTERSEADDIIYIDGKARAKKKNVFARLKPVSGEIVQAANTYKIDPNTLGAILIDEYVRAGFDDLGDFLGRFGIRDTSVGLAQVKMTTARSLIAQGYYKDASTDISDNDLYNLLVEDKTSVSFAAAVVRQHIDQWKPFVDLQNRPEILGTLYSLGSKNPHGKPESSARGNQIKSEFYPLAKEILGD